eukprot:746482-Hanusia_phi.AAC.1
MVERREADTREAILFVSELHRQLQQLTRADVWERAEAVQPTERPSLQPLQVRPISHPPRPRPRPPRPLSPPITCAMRPVDICVEEDVGDPCSLDVLLLGCCSGENDPLRERQAANSSGNEVTSS